MPDWKSEVEKRLAALRIRPAASPEVVQELVEHLEDRYAELLAGGMEESAARQAVLAELDDLEHLRVCLPPLKRERTAGDPVSGQPASGHLFADFIRDLRYGWRMTRRAPLFALFAVLSLAVGIGANTTVFTIINTLLLHPLPVKEPSRLVVLYDAPPQGAKQSFGQPALS